MADPVDCAYRRLAAAILLQAVRDIESKNDYCAATARVFLKSEKAEIWADRIDIEPTVWRAAIQDHVCCV